MIYKVTKEHIKNGKRENAHSCALALCFRQAHPNLKDLTVGGDRISFYTTNGHPEMVELSLKAQNFIEKFDNDKNSVKPMSFRLKRLA